MTIVRRFLLASSLTRLIRKERGSERVTEGYFAAQSERRSHLQVDRSQCFLILTGAGSTPEDRTEVPRSHAEALLEACAGTVIYDRTRLRVGGGREALIDRYSKPASLDLVSVEFANEGEAKAFAPPVWFGPEITDDERYESRIMALEGRPETEEVPLTNNGLEVLLDILESRFEVPRFELTQRRSEDVMEALRRLTATRTPGAVLTVVDGEGGEEKEKEKENVARLREERPNKPEGDDEDERIAGVMQGLSAALTPPKAS